MDPWFVRQDDGTVVVDPDLAYPEYLSVIGAKEATQAALEAARLTFTEDLMQVLGPPLHLRIVAGDRKWALKNFPPGKPFYTDAANAFETWYKALPGTPARRLGLV